MNSTVSNTRPLPSPRANRALLYPFGQLTGVNQSLTVPGDVNAKRFTAAAHAYAKRHGWVAAVRRLPDGNLCVWRVQDLDPAAKPVQPLPYAHSLPYAVSSSLPHPKASREMAQQRARDERAQKEFSDLLRNASNWLLSQDGFVSLATLSTVLRADQASVTRAVDFWRAQDRIIDGPHGFKWKSPQPKPVTP